MKIARSLERTYLQYINRLQLLMKPAILPGMELRGSTSLPRPTDKTFDNARRVIHILSDLYGERGHVSSKFCVTVDGEFQIIMTNSPLTRGTVTINDSGIRLYNAYDKTQKYVSLDYADDKLAAQYKRYMKKYL